MTLFSLCDIKKEDGFTRRLSKGSIIADSSDYTIAILEGTINVMSQIADDTQVMISKLRTGDIFGISNIFIHDELKTVLECTEDSELFMIRKELFKKKLMEKPEALEEYCRIMNSKIQFLIDRIADMSAKSARSSISLAILSESYKKYRTKEELASGLGISRSSLFRELSALTKEGIIRKTEHAYEILDRQMLEHYAGR